MIQPNELKIGNWVQTERGYFFKMEHIPDTKFGDYSRINPIPLTPEILEKAGFEKEAYRMDCFKKGRLRFWFNGRGGGLCYLIEEDTTTGHYIPNGGIYYLHQLQNIYHSFTGEELQIEL